MLGYYNFVSNWSRRIIVNETYDPLQNPMMRCIKYSIYLNFTNKVRVYTLNQSMWNIKTIKNYGNLSNLHVFGDYLTTQNNSHILIFNASSNYSLYCTILKNTSYIYYCTLFYGSGYLFMTMKKVNGTQTELAQYDLDIGQFI